MNVTCRLKIPSNCGYLRCFNSFHQKNQLFRRKNSAKSPCSNIDIFFSRENRRLWRMTTKIPRIHDVSIQFSIVFYMLSKCWHAARHFQRYRIIYVLLLFLLNNVAFFKLIFSRFEKMPVWPEKNCAQIEFSTIFQREFKSKMAALSSISIYPSRQ